MTSVADYSGPPNIHPAHHLLAPDRFVDYVVKNGHAAVAGWVQPGALSAVTLFNGLQMRLGVEGHVCEIGVHHGRYMIALSTLRKRGERSLAIDVFDLQGFNVDNSGLGDLQAFTKNVETWVGTGANMLIYKEDSLKVTGHCVIKLLGGRVRLFSVDGSHTCEHTLKDIRTAEASLAPGGLVVVDDFLNPAWPGVVEAVVRYLSAPARSARLAPIGYGDNKFYFTTKGYEAAYREAVTDLLPEIVRTPKTVSLCGQELLFFGLPEPAVVLAATTATVGEKLQYLASMEGLVAPPIGLRPRFESSGVWLRNAWSGIAIDLPKGEASYAISLGLTCFRHAQDPEPMIGIHALGTQVADAAFPRGTDRRVTTFNIERQALGSSDRLAIWFHNQNVRSPEEMGLSADARRLSCLLQDVTVNLAESPVC